MFGEGSLNTTFFADRMNTASTWSLTAFPKVRGLARYLILLYDDSAVLLNDDSGVQLYGI
jgi:hypothetical protein